MHLVPISKAVQHRTGKEMQNFHACYIPLCKPLEGHFEGILTNTPNQTGFEYKEDKVFSNTIQKPRKQ